MSIATLLVIVCVISDHIDCRPTQRFLAHMPMTACMSQGQSEVAKYMTSRPWLRLIEYRCETGDGT